MPEPLGGPRCNASEQRGAADLKEQAERGGKKSQLTWLGLGLGLGEGRAA